jgi:benzaldehyde dehydrogenase (NAD)
MFPATVLAGVKPGMRAFEEEIFGPVAVVVAYDTDDHAVQLANMSEFGLAAGIIAKDTGSGAQDRRCGCGWGICTSTTRR